VDKKREPLPESGPLEGFLNDEDIVEFELTSSDIWVKVFMTLNWGEKTHQVIFEVRVERDMRINHFKAYLIKSVITIWNQIQVYNLKDITFYFLDKVEVTKAPTVSSIW
jgi:hypothetical protein